MKRVLFVGQSPETVCFSDPALFTARTSRQRGFDQGASKARYGARLLR